MDELKPDQALNMLVSAARQARLTYDEHAALEQAVRVLLEVVPKSEEGDQGGQAPPPEVVENVKAKVTSK